jgi:FkbM family methyltransferase
MVKEQLKSIVRSTGYEIRRKHPDLVQFLQSRSINLILDVGANEGQFAQEVRTRGYAGKIISFEPVAETFRQLQQNCALDNNWDCRRMALGDSAGTAEINVSKNTAMSSIVSQTDIGRNSIYDADVVRIETVQIETLDAIFSEFADSRVFLKIDTQGFEQNVLNGGKHILRLLLGVQLELPLIHLYQGTWKFDEALRFMREAGFTLSQMRPVTYYSEDPVSLLEVDCIFRRTDYATSITSH